MEKKDAFCSYVCGRKAVIWSVPCLNKKTGTWVPEG